MQNLQRHSKNSFLSVFLYPNHGKFRLFSRFYVDFLYDFHKKTYILFCFSNRLFARFYTRFQKFYAKTPRFCIKINFFV